MVRYLRIPAHPDRYEAAIRMEKARQRIREANRYGFRVTQADAAELAQATAEYDMATNLPNG